jgi:hypothetical protein
MYSNTYPRVLGVKYFSTFKETLECFKNPKDIWILKVCSFLTLREHILYSLRHPLLISGSLAL